MTKVDDADTSLNAPPQSTASFVPSVTPSAASLRRRSQVTSRARRGTGPVSADDLPNVCSLSSIGRVF